MPTVETKDRRTRQYESDVAGCTAASKPLGGIFRGIDVTDDAMSRIITNIPSLQAIHRLARNQQDLSIRLNRLSTGLRINRGADDPAGLIASERLRSEIRTLQQAVENSTRASNVIATAEGALNEASALLLDLQALVLETANDSGLLEEEVRANQLQVDSILDSLDRIANTTTFAGRKLLDGSQSYLTSGIQPSALSDVELFSARIGSNSTRLVTVRVTQSAQTAQIALTGTNTSGPSTLSSTTVEIKGTLGTQLLSFASGVTLTEVAAAFNGLAEITGVSANISATGVAGFASALVLNSTTVGSDAFVSVSPIGGNFVTSNNANTTIRNSGVDAGVLIDGQKTSVRGLEATLRSNGLDTRLQLTRSFAQTLSSTSFAITGGGALFQLTPQVNSNGQINIGLNSVSTTQLGNGVDGLLYTLRTGEANDFRSRNFAVGQRIANVATAQIASLRGRLGNLLRNVIEPNINSQNITLENVTAAESVIRDADIAEEVSALTRAQLLVQMTQNTLQIANAIPSAVLSLLN